MLLDQVLIQIVNGIVTGMVLALVASGLTLIFGIMDVVNFAHGDLVMLGGFVGAVTVAATGSFWLALVVATIVIAGVGVLLQVTTLRPLLGRVFIRGEDADGAAPGLRLSYRFWMTALGGDSYALHSGNVEQGVTRTAFPEDGDRVVTTGNLVV